MGNARAQHGLALIAAAGDFFDSLRPDQQQKVRDFAWHQHHIARWRCDHGNLGTDELTPRSRRRATDAWPAVHGRPGPSGDRGAPWVRDAHHLPARRRAPTMTRCAASSRSTTTRCSPHRSPLYFAAATTSSSRAPRPERRAHERQRAGATTPAILDVMLPEMDGFELCRAIRRESDIPIVMLTARGDVMDRIVGLELGADDYLPKPFEPRELLTRLQAVLEAAAHGRVPSRSGWCSTGWRSTIEQRRLSPAARARPVDLTGFAEFRACSRCSTWSPAKVFLRDEILNRLRGQDASSTRCCRRHPREPPAPQARATGRHQDAAQRGLRLARRRAFVSRRRRRPTDEPADCAARRWRERVFPAARVRDSSGCALVLALAVAVVFRLGIHWVQHGGWREVLRPLVSNYADMIAADRSGMLPTWRRARALDQAARLPLLTSASTSDPERSTGTRLRRAASARAPPARLRRLQGRRSPETATRMPPWRHRRCTMTSCEPPRGGAPIPLILPSHRAAAGASGPACRHRVQASRVSSCCATDFDPSAYRVVRLLPDRHRHRSNSR